MQLKRALDKLGLPKTKGDVYLASLQVGTGTAETIGNIAELPRTTTHEVLQFLVREGLVSFTVRGRTRLYTAAPPVKLGALLREKEQALEEVLPELDSLFESAGSRPRMRMYEGVRGIRTVFEDTLTTRSKRLDAILSVADIDAVAGQAWFSRYTETRIASGIRLHVIRSEETEVGTKYPSSKKDQREVHLAPTGMTFNLTTYLYDNKVVYIGTQKEPFGMVIESADLYLTQKHLFDTLWQVTRVMKSVD